MIAGDDHVITAALSFTNETETANGSDGMTNEKDEKWIRGPEDADRRLSHI